MICLPFPFQRQVLFGELFDTPVAHFAFSDRYDANQTVCRVRRDSDNAETDVTSSQMGAWLEDWVGAGNNGFLVTWSDLSGSGNNATQSTAGLQAKVVDNGALVTSGGRAAALFNGVDTVLEAPDDASFDASSNLSVFAIASHTAEITAGVKTIVCKYNSGSNQREWLLGVDSSADAIAFYVGSFVGVFFETVIADTSIDETVDRLFGADFDSGVVTLYNNGSSTASTASGSLPSSLVNGASPIIIGAQASGASYSANNYWGGPISEIIVYASDQTANRAQIDAYLKSQNGLT